LSLFNYTEQLHMYNVLSLSLSLGFHNGNAIERIHKQFCKRLL